MKVTKVLWLKSLALLEFKGNVLKSMYRSFSCFETRRKYNFSTTKVFVIVPLKSDATAFDMWPLLNIEGGIERKPRKILHESSAFCTSYTLSPHDTI